MEKYVRRSLGKVLARAPLIIGMLQLKSIWRREDSFVSSTCFRSSRLQTDPAVLHGRDRRCAGFPECFYRRKLYQGAYKECTIYYHFSKE